MKRNYLKCFFAAGLLLFLPFALSSCSDDPDEQKVDPKEPPTVKVVAGVKTTTSLEFRIEASEGADRTAWVCVKKAEAEAFSAEEIFSEGTVIADPTPGGDPAEAVELDPSTDYVIAAAAAAGELFSEVSTVEMTTLAEKTPWDLEVICDKSFGDYYGNDITGGPNGQFMIGVANIPIDEEEFMTGAGFRFVFSVHSDLAADPAAAEPAPGTYTYDFDMTGEKFTFDDTNSMWMETGEAGNILLEEYFLGGELTIDKTASGQYKLDGLVTLSDERIAHVVYEGPIDWADKTHLPFTDQRVEAKNASAVYTGIVDGIAPIFDDWIVTLTDDAQNPTQIFTMELYALPSQDIDNPVLPEGIYTIDERGDKPETFVSGGSFGGEYYGTRLQVFAQGKDYLYQVSDGTIEIKRDGDRYTVQAEVTTWEETTVTVSYTGQMPVDNQYKGIREDLHCEAIASDVRIYGADKELPYNYYIQLIDTEYDEEDRPVNGGPAIIAEMSIYSDMEQPDPNNYVLPTGTYELCETYYNNWTWEYYDGDLAREATNFYYWPQGADVDMQLAFGSCTVTITKQDDDYTIEMDGYNPNGFHFTASYTGPISIKKGSWLPQKPGAVAPGTSREAAMRARTLRMQPYAPVFGAPSDGQWFRLEPKR